MINRLEAGVVPEPSVQQPRRQKDVQRDFSEGLRMPQRDAHGAQEKHEAEADTPLRRPDASEVPVPGIRALHSAAGAQVDGLLLPWQLRSQSTLSQLGSGARPSLPDPGCPVSAQFVRLAAPHTGPCDTLPVSSPRLLSSEVGGTGSVLHQDGVIAVRNAGESTEQSTARTVLAGLPNAWLERLVRWIDRDMHGVTAWVRDFHLDEDDAMRLVQEIVAFAKDNAIVLERIVVNGNERWRSDVSNLKGEN